MNNYQFAVAVASLQYLVVRKKVKSDEYLVDDFELELELDTCTFSVFSPCSLSVAVFFQWTMNNYQFAAAVASLQ
ncbi:hypothetical protein [Maribacter sp. 2-571]|uniref:hypothetical protein n=1 Tax=Maribacter sp. 2-571 TaxID=3417569 RepID=UPI003D33FCAD